MNKPHHAQCLGLISREAPRRYQEFGTYANDPILFAALAIQAHKRGEFVMPREMLEAFHADLAEARPRSRPVRRTAP